jgi:hypothetical protein
MNYQRAIKYVAAAGDDLDKLRLHYTLTRQPATDDETYTLFMDQRDDGGFAPAWATDYSSLDATCFRLAKAEQVGVWGRHAAVARAVAFIADKQHLAGEWEENTSVAAIAPPWVMPGDKDAMNYLTANCTFWLNHYGQDNDTLTKAQFGSDYLKLRLNDDGNLPGFSQTRWLAIATWQRLGVTDLVQRLAPHLGDEIPAMKAEDLTWMLVALGMGGVPANHALMYAGIVRLEKLQHPNGYWQDGNGPSVHITLEALRAMRFCRRF